MEGGPQPPPPPGYPQQPPQQPQWPPPEAPPGPGAPPGYYQPQGPPVFAGLELASWGSRAGAALLDGLLLTALWIVLAIPGVVVLVATSSDVAGAVALGIGILVAVVLGILYAPFFMQREQHNGQTLGKQWLGIRVVRVNGQRIGWGFGFLREFVLKGLALSVASGVGSALTFFLAGIGGVAPYLADYLWPLWDDQNRAIHDMIAETRVVRA